MAAPAPYPPVQAPGDSGRRHSARHGDRSSRGLLIGVAAGLAAVVMAAVAIVLITKRDRHAAGPDPYAGSYPLAGASAEPTPAITWQPKGPPAGPLPRFSGTPSRITGKITDRQAGLSYARLGAPWKVLAASTHTAAMEWTVQKPFHWWAGAYSDLLRTDFVPAAKGPDGLRAAAELDAAKWAQTYEGTLVPIAGQAIKVSGRSGWLAGYRVRTPNAFDHITVRTLVIVVVNSGRNVPAVFEVSIGKPRMLPDINTLVGSLRVIR